MAVLGQSRSGPPPPDQILDLPLGSSIEFRISDKKRWSIRRGWGGGEGIIIN